MRGARKAAVVGAAALLLGGSSPDPGPATFDAEAARRSSDLDPDARPCTPSAPWAVGTTAEEVSFLSTEWQPDGKSRRIRIRGYLARPLAPGRHPAVIVAHGLGGQADLRTVVELARNLDVVALAISGPGLAGSGGTPVTFADPRRLFATVPDVRGSWLHAYAFALQRAITYLQQRDDVDGNAVVLTGTSLGGLASFMVNGVDDRVRGILVTNAAGGLAHGAANGSWLNSLIRASGGLTPSHRGPAAFMAAFDPLGHPDQHGSVYLLAGTQDEFFPLDDVLRTFRALRAPAKTLALISDYDHEWYFGTGCPARCMPGGPQPPDASCPTTCPRRCPVKARWPYCGPQDSYNRHREAVDRWNGLLRALVAQAAGPRRPFGPPPASPIVERQGDRTLVRVSLPNPRAVRLAVSDNGGYTYGQFLLAPGPGGTYAFMGAIPAGAIVIAELEAPDGTVSTSIPELPAGFRPLIRPFHPIAPIATMPQ